MRGNKQGALLVFHGSSATHRHFCGRPQERKKKHAIYLSKRSRHQENACNRYIFHCMTTFRRRRVNIMTNTPRFCINRRASVANNNQHTTAFLSKLRRCISRIQLSQAQRACSWSCTKNSNNFSTDFINFKNCPRHSLCVKFLLSIKRKNPSRDGGMEFKKQNGPLFVFKRPRQTQRYLKGRCGIFVREKKNSWNAGIEAGDSKT